MAESLNKGEWSEFYAFIKILGDRELTAANADLTPDYDNTYGVMKIIRDDPETSRTYDLSAEDSITVTSRSLSGRDVAQIPYADIRSRVPRLLREIIAGSGASFKVHSAEELMGLLKCGKIKAASNKKGDIDIVVHDHVTNKENRVEFSIKSYLGGAPTLLNASKPTNFKFSVKGFQGDPDAINNITGGRKVMDRLKAIKKNGGSFELSGMHSPVFKRNLLKIDSAMPLFLGEFLVLFFSGEARTLKDLTQRVADDGTARDSLGDPFNFDDLKYKMKQLLINVALGMVPATDWTGFLKADGGYIVVKEDGDVVCFHIYNIDELGEYLFNNTKLETASTDRHDFASLYYDGNQLSMNLNLSIRFVK